MKKIIVIILVAVSALLFAGCSKKFSSAITLGVNDTRINITWAQAQEQLKFVIPVYSNGDWTIRFVAGGDWFSMDRTGGSGNQYVHCTAEANTTVAPRAVRLELSGQGKTIPVYIVTSTAEIAAADLDDADLDNYLQ